MFKIFCLILIPFFLLSCDDDDKEVTSTAVQGFKVAENKKFFKKSSVINFIQFSVDTVNNRLTMYEFGQDVNGRIVELRSELFLCEGNSCKTSVFNKEYETLVINNDKDEVSLGLYEEVLNSTDRLIQFTTYYSTIREEQAKKVNQLLDESY